MLTVWPRQTWNGLRRLLQQPGHQELIQEWEWASEEQMHALLKQRVQKENQERQQFDKGIGWM
jgi:hypothetical protein